MITTPGRLLIDSVLPEKYKGSYEALDDKELGAILTDLAKTDPDKYIDVISGLHKIAATALTDYGTGGTVTLDDLSVPQALRDLQGRSRQAMNKLVNDPFATSETKRGRIIKTLADLSGKVDTEVKKAYKNSDSGFALQSRSGARGNVNSLKQTAFGPIMLADSENKPVPIPVLHGYGEGLSPLEYWASANGARKGTVAVQQATADSGYLAKQLSNIGHRLRVTENDCGTDNGLIVDGGDVDNIGSVLADSVGDVPAGTLITKELIPKLENKRVKVRSTTTCQSPHGICAKCAGLREDNAFPVIGEQVGLVAARAMSEPITQSALGTKHTGGVAGHDTDKISGFKELNQFLQVPSNFIGGATLSSMDGRVESVKDNPAGTGKIVTVAGEDHFVPNDAPLLVSKGQRVEAGDALSEGVPNPAELAGYKGIGEGRKYFVERYRKMLIKNKAPVHRRNIEALSRGFINRVEITSPGGYKGHIIGDVVPYDDFVRDYEPRKGSVSVKPFRALGTYLEKPTLHYSIGTRITPRVAEYLSKHGKGDILINRDTPVFKPKVVRSVDFLKTDSDWMTRLAGEGLKKSLLDAAVKGGTSDAEGTSYIPTAANPTYFKRLDQSR